MDNDELYQVHLREHLKTCLNVEGNFLTKVTNNTVATVIT